MDFAASEAKHGDSLSRKQRSIFAGNAPEQISPVPSCAPRPPDAPAQVRSRDTGRFCRGEKIFRPCGEQFAYKGYGYAPPGHTQPGRRKCPICRAASLRGAVLAQRLWICPTRPPQKASGTKQKRHPDRMPFCLVRITGLEPAQYCYH